MSVPTLTHLQFEVIDLIGAGQRSGRELRRELRNRGSNLSGPAFYQLMSRLQRAEPDGLVEGWYVLKEIDAYTVKQKWYKLTPPGIAARNASVEFYRNRVPKLKGVVTAIICSLSVSVILAAVGGPLHGR